MKKMTEIAQELLLPVLQKNCVVCDFTLGNGYDCAFFMQQPHKIIYAFEVQEEVLINTKERLKRYNGKVQYIHDGHEQFDHYVHEKIDAAIFNFGYCPNGNKWITTKLSTSSMAVEKAINRLAIHGRLVLVLYPGHEEGKKESEYFSEWAKKLSPHEYAILKISMENRKQSTFIVCIERIREVK